MSEQNETNQPSRRSLLRAGAAAAPALFVSSVAAAQPAPAAGAAVTNRPSGPTDPRTAYPKPPFAPQHQEPPGLTSKMNPRPDHGEKGYVGSGRLAGRKALITGGDSGIGRAVVIAFAREGADIAINYLPAEESDAQEVVELIRAEGRKAVAIPGDLRDEAFCTKLVTDAHAQLGGLDIVVNNAGTQSPTDSIVDVKTETFDSIYKTNIYAPFWICRAAVPLLPAGGSIINVASIQGLDPAPSLLDYASTKAALINFTKGLAKQLSNKGIRVNAIAPGPVWTPLIVSTSPAEASANYGRGSLYNRPAQPAELAPPFVLLASNEASYMTGETIFVTGSRTPL